MTEEKKKKTFTYWTGWIFGVIIYGPRRILYRLFDLIEWDSRHASIFIYVGMFLALGVAKLPGVSSWQYWLFFFGSILMTGSIYVKGITYGAKTERKHHVDNFVCIPKQEINRQIKEQEIDRRLHIHGKPDDKSN